VRDVFKGRLKISWGERVVSQMEIWKWFDGGRKSCERDDDWEKVKYEGRRVGGTAWRGG
jgi:hypothetical protein